VNLEKDYFSLFALPKHYALTKQSIRSSARKLLKQYHPDLFSRATPQEQRLAAQFTAHINLAASVLENPIKRLQHLFEQAGVDADFNSRTIQDNAFLMQQMLLRERFDDAVEANGTGVDELLKEVDQAVLELENEFTGFDFNSPEQVKVEQAQLLAQFAKLHFFFKLQSEIKTFLKRLA